MSAADALERVKLAYASAMQHDGEALRELEKIIDKTGLRVRGILDSARRQAQVKVAERMAQAEYASPGRSTADVLEEVQQESEAIAAREQKRPQGATTQEEYTRSVQEDLQNAPAEMLVGRKYRDVFVGGLGVKHPLGGYMLGLVDKKRISGQIEQVKKGERGEHGTIRGRGLKGDFQGDAGALYLWQRKDGSLWLISGRHRYDLLMKDEKMPYHVAYVYVEDDAHNETWARMLDYENNMRDDQADELTAATYVREMKPTDEELYNKGLTRNESRSARGVYIGRQAGQFLWDLFNNGQIKGKRAAENVETICKMTEYIGDAEKKNNVQAMAAKLLAEGESWECINVCIQAMAADKNAPKEGRLKQGNLFFGKDFEAELRQRGRYAARAIAALTAKINAGAGAVKAEANAAAVAEMGFTVTRTQGEEKYTLEELVALRERFRNMAIDTELTQDALEWDGESAIDPIQRYLLDPRARQELEDREARAEELKNMEAEEYLNEHIGSLFGDGASFSVFSPAEASGLKALRAVADGAQESRFRSDTLGQDVILPLGNAGVYKDANNPKSRVVGAYGLVHLITMRMAHGESLEEAAYTASKAIMAAVNGEIVPERSNKLRKVLTLDDYACAVNVTWDGKQSAWVITGYRQNGKKSDADARRKAMYLAEGYAPDSFVRLKEVGAALDYAIARLAREYKQNNADPRRKVSKRYGEAASFSVTNAREAALRELMADSKTHGMYKEGASFSVERKYRDEMGDIISAAKMNGTYLKAPNGADTKLSPEQWALVRTRAFKEWFGDWEKDSENASKVVDENGEPLVVYHGTMDDPFSVFDGSKSMKAGESRHTGTAFWFAKQESTAKMYAGWGGVGRVMPVFLRAMNPKVIDAKCKRWDDVKWAGNKGTQNIAEWAKKKGYDAVIFRNIYDHSDFYHKNDLSDVVAVYDSTQIKSVDNRGTFDAGNADISLSMGRAAEMEMARKVNEVLLGRVEERTGEAVVQQWEEWMRRLNMASAGGEGKSRLGRGVEALAGLVSLIGATQSVLPERYKVPRLKVQMEFATWYARMMETGAIEPSEELKGDRFHERYITVRGRG